MSNLTTIQAPKLNSSEYGSNLESQFRSINDNFMKLSNYNFTKGEDGKSIKIITYNIGKNGSSTYTTAIKEALKKRYIELHGTGGKSYEDMNKDFANAKIKTAESLFDIDLEDNQKLKIHLISDSEKVVGSLPFVYIDMRFHQDNVVNVIAANSKLYENAIDLTCVMYFNENGAVNIIDNFPTLYYDKDATDESVLCWRFYGQNTGIPARGPRGPKGADTTLFVAKRAYVENAKDDTYYLRHIITNNDTIKADDFMTNEHLMHNFSGAPVIVLCDSVVSGDEGDEGENDEQSGNLWVTQLIDNRYKDTDEDGNPIIDQNVDSNKRFQVLCNDGNKIKLSFDLTQLWEQSSNIGAEGEVNVGWKIPLNSTNGVQPQHLLYTLRGLTKSDNNHQPYKTGDLILSYRPEPEGINSGDLNFGPNPYDNPYDFLIYYPTIFRNPREENTNTDYTKYPDLTTIKGGKITTNCLVANISNSGLDNQSALTVNGGLNNQPALTVNGETSITGKLTSSFINSSNKEISSLILNDNGVTMGSICTNTLRGTLSVYPDFKDQNPRIMHLRRFEGKTYADLDLDYLRIGPNKQNDPGRVMVNSTLTSIGNYARDRHGSYVDDEGKTLKRIKFDPLKDLFIYNSTIDFNIAYQITGPHYNNADATIFNADGKPIYIQLITKDNSNNDVELSDIYHTDNTQFHIHDNVSGTDVLKFNCKQTISLNKLRKSQLNNIYLKLWTIISPSDNTTYTINECSFEINTVKGNCKVTDSGDNSMQFTKDKSVLYIDLMSGIETEMMTTTDNVNDKIFEGRHIVNTEREVLDYKSQYYNILNTWKTTDFEHIRDIKKQGPIDINHRVNIVGSLAKADQTWGPGIDNTNAISLDVYHRIVNSNSTYGNKVVIGNTAQHWSSGLLVDGSIEVPGVYNEAGTLLGGQLKVGSSSEFNTNMNHGGKVYSRYATFYSIVNRKTKDEFNKIWSPPQYFKDYYTDTDGKYTGPTWESFDTKDLARYPYIKNDDKNVLGLDWIGMEDDNYWKSPEYKVVLGENGITMYTGIPSSNRISYKQEPNYPHQVAYCRSSYDTSTYIKKGGPIVKTPDGKLTGGKQMLLADGTLTSKTPIILQINLGNGMQTVNFTWNESMGAFCGGLTASTGSVPETFSITGVVRDKLFNNNGMYVNATITYYQNDGKYNMHMIQFSIRRNFINSQSAGAGIMSLSTGEELNKYLLDKDGYIDIYEADPNALNTQYKFDDIVKKDADGKYVKLTTGPSIIDKLNGLTGTGTRYTQADKDDVYLYNNGLVGVEWKFIPISYYGAVSSNGYKNDMNQTLKDAGVNYINYYNVFGLYYNNGWRIMLDNYDDYDDYKKLGGIYQNGVCKDL